MTDLLQWLPAITTLASAIWIVATMRANQKAAAAIDKKHDESIKDHEVRIRAAEMAITGLKVFDDLQARRKDPTQ